ncbi:MAG TPA: hypothetical protein VHV08_11510, partial [Pirellulales bacterium]|nr:hypothetical protein [Pirellulales bacterium]
MTKLARYLLTLARLASLAAMLVWTLPGIGAAGAAEPTKSAAETPVGVRVYSIGHSFHNFMPGILAEIAKSAGIAAHEQLG